MTNTDTGSITPHYKHGVLSQCAILPWEDQTAHEQLLGNLLKDYQPENTIQQHLVEELANIIWRKQRITTAYQANYYCKLQRRIKNMDYDGSLIANAMMQHPDGDIHQRQADKWLLEKYLTQTPQQVAAQLPTKEHYYQQLQQVLADDQAYTDIFKQLDDEDQKGWVAICEDNDIEANKKTLGSYIEQRLLPELKKDIDAMKLHPVILKQAIGEANMPSNTESNLSRYEMQLDRKFERTLAMLIKLQQHEQEKQRQVATICVDSHSEL